MMVADKSRSLKILIVDDEAFICSTIKHMLKAMGSYDVRDARNGAAALTLVQKFAPDVILCDVEMQPMSGLDFVREVRGLADPGLRDTIVIMLTASADAETVSVAMKLGIGGYILKPVSAKDLRVRIEAVLKKAPERERPDAVQP